MLDLIGSISRAGEPKVSAAAWRDVIESFGLETIASCEVANPFTRESTTLDNPLELAAIVIEGRRVGVFRWCSRGEGVDVFGDAERMLPMAEAIATRLGGEFVSS